MKYFKCERCDNEKCLLAPSAKCGENQCNMSDYKEITKEEFLKEVE